MPPRCKGNSFRKFLPLMWKNTFLIRKRHWLVTILEILLPLLLFLLMAVVRGLINEEFLPQPSFLPSLTTRGLNDAPLMKMLSRTAKKSGIHDDALKGFSSEAALMDYLNTLTLNDSDVHDNFVGVVFEGAGPDVKFPMQLSYKMSDDFTTELLLRASQRAGGFSSRDFLTPLNMFLVKCYNEILMARTSGKPDPQDKPVLPPIHDAVYMFIARYMLPSVVVLSFITLCIAVVKRVVEEKETGVRELMRLMGMEGWALWVSWLVDALLVRLISLALIVWLLKVELSDEGAVLSNSDGSVLYVLLLAYTVPAVISCFAISSFFSEPTLAVNVSIILWIASISLPFISLIKDNDIAMLLLPNMGLYYMFTIIAEFEKIGSGAQWWNLLEPSTSAAGHLSLGLVLLMFLVNCLVFTLITWYVSSVCPGQFGVARPWYFPFTKDFWMPSRERQEDYSADTLNFERPLSQSRKETDIGVFIRGLTKTYPGLLGRHPLPAVQGVSLNLYKGEVTALLGSNGAGKTTTMSILTGMIGASGGSVTVLGHDLGTELSAVRSSLGLCPQHNMLFKDLTVREHLIFFAMLKGNSYKASSREAEELVEKLQLREKWNQLPSTLSGGIKRKLSLAIALIGGSKVLILDQPTSGLDPESRRMVWNLLKDMRGERTILLSTDYMEEADVLGDTIAIMAHGKVQCCGSSLYLKRLYGAGYHLTLMGKQDCDVARVTGEVRAVVTEAELVVTRGGSLSFRVPSECISKFPQLLDRLENEKDKLGITNLSVSITTMEEVFLRVVELAEKKIDEKEASLNVPDFVVANEANSGSVQGLEKNTGWRLWLQQMSGLVVKKWLFTRRRWLHLLFQAVMPLLSMMVTVSMSTGTLHRYKSSDTSRLIEPSQLEVPANEEEPSQSYEDLLMDTHQQEQFQETVSVAVVWLTIAPLGWLFVTAATIVLPLQERICGSRQLQVMSGCSHLMVWLSYLIVDVAISCVLAVLTVCIIPLLDNNATFSQGAELGTLFLLLFLYGMSGSAFAYAMSFAKNTSAGAYALLVTINLFVSFIVNITLYSSEITVVLIDPYYKNVATWLRCIFGLLLPHSALTSALSHFGSTAKYNAQCRNMSPSLMHFNCNRGASSTRNTIACCENLCGAFNKCFKPVPYLSWSGTKSGGIVQQYGPAGREVLFFTLGVPLWLAVTLLIDCGAVARAREWLLSWLEGRMRPRDLTQLDEDVRCEQTRVRDCIQDRANANKTVLAVDDLAKDFGVPIFHPRFSAVRGVSFTVAPGECFGLLGVNGAGKSIMFRMLTGVEAPTRGDVWLRGSQLSKDRSRYLRNLGYCPKFDAQLGVLTGRETLALYGNLRGLPRDKINGEILKWLSMLGLLEYGSQPTSSYSGGNRRKLSVAMALIGEPPLVLLEEPSSDVDPMTRRLLWTVLERCQQAGQAIVLSSHSMDECEALCTRLAIMVAGQLGCLGTTAHLKQKFGQGFSLVVKVRGPYQDNALRDLKRDVERRLGPCELKDKHQNLLHYHLTDKRWSQLFSVMEDLKGTHDVLGDYTLSENTLEQVFLSFTTQTCNSLV